MYRTIHATRQRLLPAAGRRCFSPVQVAGTPGVCGCGDRPSGRRSGKDTPFHPLSTSSPFSPQGSCPVRQRRIGCGPAALRYALVLLVCFAGVAGCKSTDYVSVRKIPKNPLEGPLQLLSKSGPQPTDRTVQLLRRNDLGEALKKNQPNLLVKLQRRILEEPSPDKVQAFAELAYINGKRAENQGKDDAALEYYAGSVTHAYLYLFDDRFRTDRNPYDPQFRRACDMYNVALESAMRIINKHGCLKPGQVQKLKLGEQELEIEVAMRGAWPPEDIDRVEFVSDYEVQGLTNHYHTFGLGVPLIAVRKPPESDKPQEQFYPPGLSFPVTAFLRVRSTEDRQDAASKKCRHCVLELYDPLVATDIVVAGRRVPLETDLSTPLAYLLNQPAFREKDVATLGLINPGQAQEAEGLYMLEPFDPHKIPVLMVHGLWSSPMTWMEMFNDLRALPEIRDNYQFWFYLYPTGQPFWISADRAAHGIGGRAKRTGSAAEGPALDQMVLIGHSMGGLVSRWQTLESGDDFWQLVSDRSLESCRAEREDQRALKELLYFPAESFHPPRRHDRAHRTGEASSPTVTPAGWAGKLIALPDMLVRTSTGSSATTPASSATRNC